MTKAVFGEIEGYPTGSWWPNRTALQQSGVHRPPQAGICGTKKLGAESIVLSGGYPDDQDSGGEIIYTGRGGQDQITKQQIADQSFEASGNSALVTAQFLTREIRVIRGKGGDPKLSPETGFRYDGLFTVVEHWMETGIEGFNMCRFKLVELRLCTTTLPNPHLT